MAKHHGPGWDGAGQENGTDPENGTDRENSAGQEDGAGRANENDAPARAARFASDVSEAIPARRRRLATSLAAAARSGARVTGRGARAARRGGHFTRRGARHGAGWLAGQVMAMAPRLRVRDQAALRARYPGASSEEIGDALVDAAAKASAAVGGAVGVWAALPLLPAFPAEVATETLAVVGIEVKLVAELHEAYGQPAPGGPVERMTAYLAAWTQRRGVFLAPGGLMIAAGSPVARRLRRRLAARAGRSAFALMPLLTGAAAGALLNRRETRRLGQAIRADLRQRAPTPGP